MPLYSSRLLLLNGGSQLAHCPLLHFMLTLRSPLYSQHRMIVQLTRCQRPEVTRTCSFRDITCFAEWDALRRPRDGEKFEPRALDHESAGDGARSATNEDNRCNWVRVMPLATTTMSATSRSRDRRMRATRKKTCVTRIP